MSYLVDALRKAERERRSGAADVGALSSTAQPLARRTGSHGLLWFVAMLAVCNAALLLYLLLPPIGESAAAPHVETATPPAVAAAAPKLPAAATGTAAAVAEQGAGVPRADTRNLRIAERPAPVADVLPRGSQERGSALTPTPFDPVPPDDLPEVTINGHLYSRTPGRSFILVGARRYHEGERLAAGPAIVRIDADGAILNYRGHRYHVDGPG